MSSRRDDSRRRRDYSPRRRSSSSSPGPSRDRSPPKPRDPRNLPESFGRIDTIRVDDELSVLQRMSSSYKDSPLHNLYQYLEDGLKVKVWTRNHKDVRGVISGYIIAFDKHWNLILKDCSDVFHKPKKSKTPFLRNIGANENLPDIPTKVAREKKQGEEAPVPEPPAAKETEGDDTKKKKKAKKSKTTIEKRSMKKIFIRGDNVVMVSPDVSVPESEKEESKES